MYTNENYRSFAAVHVSAPALRNRADSLDGTRRRRSVRSRPAQAFSQMNRVALESGDSRDTSSEVASQDHPRSVSPNTLKVLAAPQGASPTYSIVLDGVSQSSDETKGIHPSTTTPPSPTSSSHSASATRLPFEAILDHIDTQSVSPNLREHIASKLRAQYWALDRARGQSQGRRVDPDLGLPPSPRSVMSSHDNQEGLSDRSPERPVMSLLDKEWENVEEDVATPTSPRSPERSVMSLHVGNASSTLNSPAGRSVKSSAAFSRN